MLKSSVKQATFLVPNNTKHPESLGVIVMSSSGKVIGFYRKDPGMTQLSQQSLLEGKMYPVRNNNYDGVLKVYTPVRYDEYDYYYRVKDHTGLCEADVYKVPMTGEPILIQKGAEIQFTNMKQYTEEQIYQITNYLKGILLNDRNTPTKWKQELIQFEQQIWKDQGISFENNRQPETSNLPVHYVPVGEPILFSKKKVLTQDANPYHDNNKAA